MEGAALLHGPLGRFAPDVGGGERIELAPDTGDPRTGVRFVSRPVPLRPGLRGLRYVFRFSDAAWNPPLPGGATPAHALGGYGYDARLLAPRSPP